MMPSSSAPQSIPCDSISLILVNLIVKFSRNFDPTAAKGTFILGRMFGAPQITLSTLSDSDKTSHILRLSAFGWGFVEITCPINIPENL